MPLILLFERQEDQRRIYIVVEPQLHTETVLKTKKKEEGRKEKKITMSMSTEKKKKKPTSTLNIQQGWLKFYDCGKLTSCRSRTKISSLCVTHHLCDYSVNPSGKDRDPSFTCSKAKNVIRQHQRPATGLPCFVPCLPLYFQ